MKDYRWKNDYPGFPDTNDAAGESLKKKIAWDLYNVRLSSD